MSERHWDPIELPNCHWPLSHLDEQIERAFDELLTSPWMSEARGWLPQIDISETPSEFIIEADMPGVGLDELQISVDGRHVTISGSRSDRRSEFKLGIIHVERRHGAFSRRLTLPKPVVAEALQVSQEHGVIRIRLHKQSSQEQA